MLELYLELEWDYHWWCICIRGSHWNYEKRWHRTSFHWWLPM